MFTALSSVVEPVSGERYDPRYCARSCADTAKCPCKTVSILSLWQQQPQQATGSSADDCVDSCTAAGGDGMDDCYKACDSSSRLSMFAVPDTKEGILSSIQNRNRQRYPVLEGMLGKVAYGTAGSSSSGSSSGGGKVLGAASMMLLYEFDSTNTQKVSESWQDSFLDQCQQEAVSRSS